jgi:hypothetical protein
MSEIDYPSLILPVASHFWGAPRKDLTTGIGTRFGSNGSKSIVFKTGEWYDHEQQEGSGVLELIMREVEHVSTRADAVRWLEDNGFLAKDPAAPTQPPLVQPQEPPPPEAPPEDDRLQEKPTGKWTLVEFEAYHTRDGEELYEVCRIQWKMPDGSWVLGKKGKPKKTFVQRRPSGRADGSKAWGLSEGEYMRSAPGRDWKPFSEEGFDQWSTETRERGLFLPAVPHTIFHHRELELAIEAGKIILLPEGERKAKVAEKLGFGGSTNSGGAANWRDEFAAHFRGADVVIPIDNDEAGRAAGERKARSLRGIAARVRVLDFAAVDPSFKPGFDIVDWEAAGGTAEQLQSIIDGLPDWRPSPPKSKFGAVNLRDIGTGLGRKHTWLVQDMIELGGSCALAGFSQSGKSFLTIKLTFAIVMGEQFFGRDVMQGMVVYQLGEGEAGFEKRIEGFMKDKGIESIDGLPLVILPKKINLFASDDDADALISEIKEWSQYHEQPCRMVVIDTYNKATRGMNEISGQDNGKVIDRVERISRETGATVVVIDHLSMGGRIRGHGSKTDDMTNTVRVEKDEKRVDNNGRPIRYLVLAKNKDGEAGQKIPFVLRQVVNGFDDKGRAITTCVVDPPDGSQEELERSGRLPLNQATVLKAVRDTVEREGVLPPAGLLGVPSGRLVVPYKGFIAELERKWQYSAPENEPEQRKAEIHRLVKDACKKLLLAGYIDRDNPSGLIWWTGKTDRPLQKPKPAEAAAPPPEPSPYMTKEDMDVPF